MIQDARYTSPSGKETTFEWENTRRRTELKTGIYTFPGKDGAHVQHQGAGARSFPLTCVFSGNSHMEKADAFEAMLIERGVGELQHPTYGTIKVVPTGDIERSDDPVNRFGESTVTITFTETIINEESGDLTEVAADAIDGKLDEFTEAAVYDFADALVIDDIATQIAIVSELEMQTQSIIDSMEPLAATDKRGIANWLASARELRDNISNLYQRGLSVARRVEDVYVRALNIGRLTLNLMNLPSTLAVSLAQKIKGYSILTANLINQYKTDPFGIGRMKAAYATASLAITGACAAIASGSALTVAEIAAMTGAAPGGMPRQSTSATQSSVNSSSGETENNTANASAGATSREEAIEAASQVMAFLDTTIDFQDTKIESLNMQNAENFDAFIDASPSSHLALSELVHLSIQLILNASFALPMQKTITLDRDRQVVELCAELYGTTNNLDDFIIQNNFSIDEIELLPMGKRVSYYVQSA